MIVDLRTYTYLPAKYRKFLKGYEETGFALTSRHLGKTLGVFRPESGVQNRTFQFFMYEDSPHRDICRKGMLADPAWMDFVKLDSDALLQQMNTLLIPTAFSPVGGKNATPPNLVVESGSRLFELHSWTCLPEKFDDAMNDLADGGATLLARHNPDVIAWFTADTGVDNRIFLLSAFADGAARDAARKFTRADAEVAAFQRRLRAMSFEEEAQLLLPMPYSPLR